MRIDTHDTDNLARRHDKHTTKNADLQRLALDAEDALSALEDREERRARRTPTRPGNGLDVPIGGRR